MVVVLVHTKLELKYQFYPKLELKYQFDPFFHFFTLRKNTSLFFSHVSILYIPYYYYYYYMVYIQYILIRFHN